MLSAVAAGLPSTRMLARANSSLKPPQMDPHPDPERAWEHAETTHEIWAALGRLTGPQRAAIVQRYYLGLTEAEIAADLACPQSTVKSRLHAARERLRSLLRALPSDLEMTP
jgi:RNA polymerase sigma-70 factor (ECF subfamily)